MIIPGRLRSFPGKLQLGLLIILALGTQFIQTVYCDENRVLKDEWAIILSEDTTAADFAALHHLEHLGSIPGTGADLFRLKSDRNSNSASKSKRHVSFEAFLRSQQHKATENLPDLASRRLKRSADPIDDSQIVWFQQQELRRRVKRSVGPVLPLPSDPLFPSQWHLQPPTSEHVSIDVFGAWSKGYHGEGVTIAICDDGFDLNHPDIKANFNSTASFNFNKNISDVGPNSLTVDWHGTSSGGMAAARDDGSTCGVGAAYRAQLSAIAILQFNEISDADEARALSYRTDINDIYSNSWGPTDDGNRKEGPKPLTAVAMEHSIRNGRNGLGSIYVWSSGNGRRSSDSCNYDGYANWRYTITVGAVDYQGIQAWYSEACAAIHFVTPSSGSSGAPRNLQHVISSDLLGSHGLETGDCNMRFSGTSAACPLAAGIVALVLQARPDLNWIELQQILIDSTIKNNPTDGDWAQNAAGRWFNPKYGFGLINATEAVMNAERWNNQISLSESTATASASPRTAFSPISGGGFGATSTLTIAEEFSVRHVEVYLTASTLSSIGSLKVVLTAPSGTVAVLADKHGDTNKHYNNWRFTSLRSWGETSKGVWTLTITDVTGTLGGELATWTLTLYGGESIALPPGTRIIPRPSGRVPSELVTTPIGAPSNMTSGVSRSVPNQRIILLLISSVPLIILGVWAGYSKIVGKNLNTLLLVGTLALILTVTALLPWWDE